MRSMLAAGAIFVCSIPAFAEDAKPTPAIDFTQTLLGANGKALMEGGDDCKPGQMPGRDCSQVPMTLSDAAVGALESALPDDGTDAKKKFERDLLARKVYNNAKAELSPEDVAAIKDRIGKVWNAPQVGAAWPLLDPTLKK